jgi:hypothetical protein
LDGFSADKPIEGHFSKPKAVCDNAMLIFRLCDALQAEAIRKCTAAKDEGAILVMDRICAWK